MINNNFQRILIKFGLWLGTGFLICLVGITNVFGLTYTDIGDKADITVVLVSTDYSSNPFNVPKNSSYNFNQVLEIDYQVSNYNFEANKNYQLESHLSQQQLTNANYYSVQGLNGEQCLISYENSIFTGAYPRWAFQCPHATNNITLTIKNSNNQYLWATGQTNIFTWTSALLKYSNTSLSSDNQNTDAIINNNNQNTQNIINNNNQNTQKIIDENKKNFNTESDCENLSSLDKYNLSSGNYFEQKLLLNNYKRNTTYTLSFDITTDREPFEISIGYGDTYFAVDGPRKQGFNSGHIVFTFTTTLSDKDYNKFKNLWIRIPRYSSTGVMWNANVSNIMLIEGSSEKTYCKYGTKVYTNKLDEQKNAINNLDNTLKDDNVDDNGIASAFEDFNDYLDDNSTITQLITLPITLYTAILNNINGTCSPFNLGKLYGKDLILPCINISQYLGNSLWSMIDIIISGFAVYAISKKMIKVFNNFSSLREGDVIDD